MSKQDEPMIYGKSQETKSNRFDRYGDFTKSLNLPNIKKLAMPVKYINDGKGTDGYIRTNNGGFAKSPDPITAHVFKKTLRSFSSEIPSLLNNYNTKVSMKSLSVMKKKPFKGQSLFMKKSDSQKETSDLRAHTEPSLSVFSKKNPINSVTTVDHVFKADPGIVSNFRKGTMNNNSTGNFLRADIIKRRGLGNVIRKSPSKFVLNPEPDLLWDVSKIRHGNGSFEYGKNKGGIMSRKERSEGMGVKLPRHKEYLNQDLEIRNYDGLKAAMRNLTVDERA